MNSNARQSLTDARRWVIKIGSAVLTDNGQGLNKASIERLAQNVIALREDGAEVIIVSSGAVAAGLARLNMTMRPSALDQLQAAAAVGQSSLVQAYEAAFAPSGYLCAQILLSHDDVRSRERYLNARATLQTLLAQGVIPIVNENDTVVTDEIRFGDNDTLAALVANLIDADLLVMLTDQAGLFNTDPRATPDAQLITEADAHDTTLDKMVSEGTALGRGGMISKLRAARLAARSGALAIIADGREPETVGALKRGAPVGTLLTTDKQPQPARKQWLASLLYPKGAVTLDDGAVRGICDLGRSLLPVGVVDVSGDFVRGDLVRCLDNRGQEIARGLCNYSAVETRKLRGRASTEIESILGFGGDEELIHRDNLITTR
ncbi:MAG: glutamate 5-kinase [Halieaceae bacterium]|nr:glutamate 5-kinase [Halieaceae bacterium]MBT6180693.1 glutamate 5-kinase [Halieaceae bacterium]